MHQETSEAMVYIQTLTERVGKHSVEMEKGFGKIYDRLDRIQAGQEEIRLKAAEERLETHKAIQAVKDFAVDVQKAATERSHNLNIKVVAIAATIGMAGGGVGARIDRKIFPPEEIVSKDRTVIKYEASAPPDKIP